MGTYWEKGRERKKRPKVLLLLFPVPRCDFVLFEVFKKVKSHARAFMKPIGMRIGNVCIAILYSALFLFEWVKERERREARKKQPGERIKRMLNTFWIRVFLSANREIAFVLRVCTFGHGVWKWRRSRRHSTIFTLLFHSFSSAALTQ